MKKRLLSFFLAVCMIFSLLPVSVIAEEAATTSGTCGENLTWTLEDGTLTISGTGAMSDYSTSSGHTSAPWGDYCETITSAVIENGVTSIGNYAFYECTGLASIAMPEGIASIGDDAFKGCTSLASINIPKSVTSIGNEAFFGCGLTSATIPAGVTNVSNYAFGSCENLTSVIIENGVTSIDEDAFSNCTSLESVTVPESLTSIGNRAFSDCSSLESIYIPKNVTSIGALSFLWCENLKAINVSEENTAYCSENGVLFNKDKSILHTYPAGKAGDAYTIPNGVKTINAASFGFCTSLKSLTVPISVTEIREQAFYGSGLTDIYYAGTTEQWAAICTSSFEYLFGETASSVIIHCSDRETPYGITWSIKDGVLTVSGLGAMPYFKNYTYTPWYSCRNVTDVTIADSVTVIERGAFSYCESLKSLNISVNVTDVCDAFGGCTNLTDIYYGGTAAQWKNALWDSPRSVKCITIHCTDKDILPGGTCGDNVTWTLQNNTLTISGAGDIEDYLGYSHTPWYSKSEVITSVVIDSGVTGIGTYAFSYFFSLQSISIPKSVTKIGGHAFEYCQELNDVVIPDGVTAIEESTFEHCYRLESITIPAGVTSIGEYAFYGCESLTKIQFGGTIAQWEALLGNADSSELRNACVYCSDGKITPHGTCGTNLTWELDDGVLTISGTGVMENYLQDDEGAPWSEYSGNIKSIVIKNGVTSIGNNAFANCYNAAAVMIPDSVKAIGSSAFDSCSKLKQISIPGGVREIKYGTFRYCSGLESIVIPDGIELIDEYAFSNCTSLKSINVPAAVTELDTSAFEHCDSLSRINVDENNSYFSSVDGVLFSKSKSTLLCCPNGIETDSYQIPDYVTSLAGGAFKYCSGLTSITVPDSVRSIGGYAFAGCKNIKEITLPGEIDEISDEMFWGCESLMSIVVPDGVQRIGDSAFYQCYALSSVSIPDSVQSIGWDAFYYCGSLTSIELPSGLESINDSTFSHCGALESITIPNTVKSICERAFSNCSALKDIYFNGSADEWLGIEVSECSSTFLKQG